MKKIQNAWYVACLKQGYESVVDYVPESAGKQNIYASYTGLFLKK